MVAQAVAVDGIYKYFGMPVISLWRKNPVPFQPSENGGGKKVVTALDDVSFSVNEGEIFGILGANGGGKSTLIRLISTLLLPDRGQIRVYGYDVARSPLAVQRLINRVSVDASFVKKLNSLENLAFSLRLYGVKSSDIQKQVLDTLTRLGLERESIYKPMEQLSRGMQQKVAVSRALLTNPKVLLLDEPTTGLDPRSKREVHTLVRELRESRGTTILLTTHDMLEAEALCDRIAILEKGKVAALDTPDNLRRLVPARPGERLPSLEEVFLALTGTQLVSEDEEIGVEV